MEKYILAIDQGTTSSRAILFDKNGRNVASNNKEFPLIYPKPGWVEADADVIFLSVVEVINNVLKEKNITLKDIDSIGITNQRETTVIWEKNTGKPIYNAIIWQSRQTQSICEKYAKHKIFIHKRTGLYINPYFSASKIRFILDNVKGAQKRAENGELCFGTIDSWLIAKLTSLKNHYTDTTNASRTLLFNIFTNKWDEDLLKLFNIPKVMLPEVKPCNSDFGTVDCFHYKANINAVMGDQHAALFGEQCFKPGDCKNTYGTGCFLLMNIGKEPKLSKNGLLTTIAWNMDGNIDYALEGSVFVGGASIQWLRDEMKIIEKASDSDYFANQVSDTGGVYFVPAFVGLGAPYWDDDVRGSIFGITRGTQRYHIVRATLQAIAFQSSDVLLAMEKDSHIKISSLKVDGGATNSDVLMQFQSDINQISIKKMKCCESTALGVAFMSGLKSGFWSDISSIECLDSLDKIYNPKMSKVNATKLLKEWYKAVQAAKAFK